MKADIRKIVVMVEETRRECGRGINPPTRKAAAVAVIANPFAAAFVEDLEPLMDVGAELGGLLGEKCVAALRIEPAQAESYGKAAMVGERGELEHAAAILHPKLGKPLREAVEKGSRARAVFEEDGRTRHSRWMCRWVIRMRPMSDPISTEWRSDSATRRERTRSWSPSQLRTAAARSRA